jgi:hypothetical protein
MLKTVKIKATKEGLKRNDRENLEVGAGSWDKEIDRESASERRDTRKDFYHN